MATITDDNKMSVPGDYGAEAVPQVASFLGQLIARLPLSAQGKRDIWAFVADLSEAETEDDVAYILAAIKEVLQGPQGGVTKHAFEKSEKKSEGYQKWVAWISSRVRAERNAAGLTQDQLAEKSGLPQSHISRIENARHSPSHATLGKIAAALSKPLKVFDPSTPEEDGLDAL
jgi:hypothetical protein